MFTFSSNNILHDDANDSASSINNGQQNLIILIVDQLASTKPEMISIWLLITFPEFSNLTLVPIYPSNLENLIKADLDLKQAFALTDHQTLDPMFTDLLHDLFHWDYYLITDQIGVNSIKRILSQSTLGYSTISEQTNPVLLPQTGQEMDFNLRGQVESWDGICSDLSRISNTEQLEDLFKQVSPYFNTNLRWKKFSNQWSFDPSDGRYISCDFPTLTLNTP
jgi:hypothetical protein